MRYCIVFCCFLGVLSLSLDVRGQSRDTISVNQASSYLEKEVVLKGVLMRVTESSDIHGRSILFLDIDARYPKNPVTVTIYSEAVGLFTSLHQRVNHCIYISGFLEDYKGKPAIGISKKDQIQYCISSDF